MKAYLQAYFDKLKTLVLDKAQIKQLVPADCYRLALEIKAATNKSVSETTIKRVFGFASSIHQPSIYTLNALAEYCGFDGWDSFYTFMERGKLQTSQQKTWGEIALNATKISLFNIQSNKHRCGIPYHLTIDREYLQSFIERFKRSGATAGILHGPAGHGKTIAISRWVENQISLNHKASTHDIYLFTNSLSLLQGMAFGYHCNRWLAHLLGFETSDLLDTFMEGYRVAAPGNFYLVIDELHCDLVPDRQFYNIMSQFIEMVRHFAQFNWFRIVLVLRDVTLLKYENLFKETLINPQWFSDLGKTMVRTAPGMPSFSNTEVCQLVRNITGKIRPYTLLKQSAQNLVNVPLFFQYYYELVGAKLNPNQVTDFDEYLIAAQYLKKRVFNGINTLAKQALMEELTTITEERNGTLEISKKQAYTIIKQYRSAYNDLIYCGLLQEASSGGEVRQYTVIRFQSDLIATYFHALQLFSQHEHVERLIDALERTPFSKHTKTGLLKWLILFYTEMGDLRLINQIAGIPFLENGRSGIVSFICDGLHKLTTTLDQSVQEQLIHALYDSPFVDYALNHTDFQVECEPNVAKLLDFKLSDAHEIVLRSKLAFIALLKWEEEAFLAQFEQLSAKQSDAYAGFVANPFFILSYLYQYFKEGEIDPDTSEELNALYHRLSLSGKLMTNQLFDLLIYTLVKVSKKVEIAHRYLDNLKARINHPAIEDVSESDFAKLIYALFLLECGEAEAAQQQLSQQIPAHQQTLSYRLLYAIFLLQSGLPGQAQDTRKVGQEAISLCDSYGLKLIESYCRVLILETVPKDEQSLHINSLKYHFTAFGYTIGLKTLSRKYG